MTVTVSGYLILILIDFYDYFSPFSPYSAYEVRNNCCLFEKPFKLIEEWGFSFKNIFFRFRDIYVFASKVMTS